jgi:hypothetical protein
MQQIVDFMPLHVTNHDKMQEGSAKGKRGSSAKGKNQGSNGLYKPKFHANALFPIYMEKYGVGANFTGSHGERFLKDAVKKLASGTQRRNNTFTNQISALHGMEKIINLAHSYVRHMCPQEKKHEYVATSSERRGTMGGNSTPETVMIGKYDLYGTWRGTTAVDYSINWLDRKKTVLQVKLHNRMYHALESWGISEQHFEDFECVGYTEARVTTGCDTVYYRASEDFQGGPWYSWALLEDPVHKSTYIGQIVGFFRMVTPNYPTFKRLKMDRNTMEEVASMSSPDDTLYVVAVCSEEYFSEEKLDKSLVTEFKMEAEDKTYIFPITAIRKPLIVINNFGSETVLDYLHVLPKVKWAPLFRNLIESLKKESLKSDECDEDGDEAMVEC